MTLYEWKLNKDNEIIMYITLGDVTWRLFTYPESEWEMVHKEVIYDRNIYLVHLVKRGYEPTVKERWTNGN